MRRRRLLAPGGPSRAHGFLGVGPSNHGTLITSCLLLPRLLPLDYCVVLAFSGPCTHQNRFTDRLDTSQDLGVDDAWKWKMGK